MLDVQNWEAYIENRKFLKDFQTPDSVVEPDQNFSFFQSFFLDFDSTISCDWCFSSSRVMMSLSSFSWYLSGEEKEMDSKACVSVRIRVCVCVSQLTIFHPELRQPYTSVVSWQLLLNSDIELLRAAKRKDSTKILIATHESNSVRIIIYSSSGSFLLNASIN